MKKFIKKSLTVSLSFALFAGLNAALPLSPAQADECIAAYIVGNGTAVKFDGVSVRGGQKVMAISNGTFSIPAMSRAGFTFAGWLSEETADQGGVAYDNLTASSTSFAPVSSQCLDGVIWLFAQWTEVTYSVSYNYQAADGGSMATPQTVKSGDKILVGEKIVSGISSQSSPTKTGYTLGGWFYGGRTYQPNQEFFMPPSAAVQFTAVWTATRYNITFDGNGNTSGSVPSQLTYTTDDEPTSISSANTGNLQRSGGYTFGGWGSTPDTTTPVTSYNGLSSTTLYAIWSGSRYTVSFSLGDDATGTVPASQSGKIAGSTITLPVAGNIAKTGYSLLGWNDGSSSYPVGGTFTVPSSSKQLTAVWSANVYSITYNVNNPSWAIDYSSQNYTSGSPAITLPIPTLTSSFPGVVEFDSWVDPDGTHLGANFTPTSNITLWANWTWLTHTFTWNANGGSTPVSSSTWKTNESWVTAPIATRAGYTQTGWYSAASGGNWETNGGLSYRNWASKTLYARWTPNTYPLQFVSWDRSTYLKYKVGSSAIALTIPTRTGYEFDGWFTSATGGIKIGSGAIANTFVPTLLDCNITYGVCPNQQFFAQWTAKTYTISFDANGASSGTVPSNQSFTSGGTKTTLSGNTATPALAKPFYSFGGWSATSGGTSKVTSFGSAADKTFYAIWNPISYKVTYNSNGSGSSVTPTNATSVAGAEVTLPTPTRAGYTFSGWYTARTNGTLVGIGEASYQPTSAVTLFARWERI